MTHATVRRSSRRGRPRPLHGLLLVLLVLCAPGTAAAAVSNGFDLPLGDGSNPNSPPITQGWCVVDATSSPHLGIDWGAGAGAQVLSVSNGWVQSTGNAASDATGYGNWIKVRHQLPDGSTWYSFYGHLRNPPVVGAGAEVGRRQLLGYVGSTGNSTGPHLHFAISNVAGGVPPGYGGCGAGGTVDPVAFIAARRTFTSSNPFGSHDEAVSPSPGQVRVRGWAIDPDARTQSIEMHVYLGGQAGTPGVEGRAFRADGSRPDVAAAHGGAGAAHGLDQTFDTNKRGAQEVCVYAINVGAGSNVLLGCRTLTIADPDPVGAYDELTAPAQGGVVRVRGWAFDPNARTAPSAVHVYVGGEAGQAGTEGNAITANTSRPDVAKVHAGVGDAHGYDATLTTKKRGAQKVCVYAINSGPGGNRLLGCRTTTIGDPVPVVAAAADPGAGALPSAPAAGGAAVPAVARVACGVTSKAVRRGRAIVVACTGAARVEVRVRRLKQRKGGSFRSVKVTSGNVRIGTSRLARGRWRVTVRIPGRTLAARTVRVR